MSNRRSKPTLVACSACDFRVSNDAAACPRCGQPIAARYVHSPSQELKMDPVPSSRVQNRPSREWEKRPLTEREKTLSIFGLVSYQLQKNPLTQKAIAKMGLQSLTGLQKIGLAILATVVGGIFIAALIEGSTKTENSGSSGNKGSNNIIAENPTNIASSSPQSPSAPPPSLSPDTNSPDYQDGFKRGLREGNGWVKQFKGGTTPPPALISAAGQTQAEKLKPNNPVLWQSGWQDGFAKGYTSTKWAGRQPDDYEQLSWGNAKPDVRLYDDNGKLRMTVVSIDQTAGIITVKYPKESGGVIENKLLEAMSKILLVRKDDPALHH